MINSEDHIFQEVGESIFLCESELWYVFNMQTPDLLHSMTHPDSLPSIFESVLKTVIW